MALPNIFTADVTAQVIDRINKLTPTTPAQWGKMSVAQMLAHCSVTYEFAYEERADVPNAFMKIILKLFIKNIVVGEKTYAKNSGTAPSFVIKDNRDFEKEKQRLINYIQQTQQKGAAYFEGRNSVSFGVLSAQEWNNMFYKHLDHHLAQFGV